MRPVLPALAALALLLPGVPATGAAGDDGPVRVAILDTGIQAGHPELAPGQVVAWKDFLADAPLPYDDNGHGTAVASRAAGATLGAAPGARLVVGKVLNANAGGDWATVAAGIRWALQQDADVVSVSIWQPARNPEAGALLAQALREAREAGVLVVWIAGNGGNQAVPTPATLLPGASSSDVLVVGASNEFGQRSGYSQLDPELLAQGTAVRVATLEGGSAAGSGTSYAAPWVAGAAARLLAEGAPRDPDWLEWVLLHAARDDPAVSYVHEGYGVLGPAELDSALAVARGDAPVPAPDARDAFHVAATGARSAQYGTPPSGALPPGVLA